MRRLLVPYTCYQVSTTVAMRADSSRTLRLVSTTPFFSRGSIAQEDVVSKYGCQQLSH